MSNEELYAKVMKMSRQEIMTTRVTITESQGDTRSDDLLYALIYRDVNWRPNYNPAHRGNALASFHAIIHVARTAPELITAKGLKALKLSASHYEIVFAYLFDMINSCAHIRGAYSLAELCSEVIHQSVFYNNTLVTEMLIKGGANINHVTNSGDTVLSVALQNHDYTTIETIKLLLKLGADPNFKTRWYGSPLHQVLGWCRNPEKLKETKNLLLAHGAKVL